MGFLPVQTTQILNPQVKLPGKSVDPIILGNLLQSYRTNAQKKGIDVDTINEHIYNNVKKAGYDPDTFGSMYHRLVKIQRMTPPGMAEQLTRGMIKGSSGIDLPGKKRVEGNPIVGEIGQFFGFGAGLAPVIKGVQGIVQLGKSAIPTAIKAATPSTVKKIIAPALPAVVGTEIFERAKQIPEAIQSKSLVPFQNLHPEQSALFMGGLGIVPGVGHVLADKYKFLRTPLFLKKKIAQRSQEEVLSDLEALSPPKPVVEPYTFDTTAPWTKAAPESTGKVKLNIETAQTAHKETPKPTVETAQTAQVPIPAPVMIGDYALTTTTQGKFQLTNPAGKVVPLTKDLLRGKNVLVSTKAQAQQVIAVGGKPIGNQTVSIRVDSAQQAKVPAGEKKSVVAAKLPSTEVQLPVASLSPVPIILPEPLIAPTIGSTKQVAVKAPALSKKAAVDTSTAAKQVEVPTIRAENPLAQEARKYKSAEEFVEAKSPENQFVDNFINRNFNKDEKGYWQYSEGVLKYLKPDEVQYWKEAAKKDYVGYTKAGGIPTNILTKSQLTDIYNQATKATPTVAPEAAKPIVAQAEVVQPQVKEAWQMTRKEFDLKQNTLKLETIQKAIQEGKSIVLSTQHRTTRITKPEHIRITGSGELQIPERGKWVFVGSEQVDRLAKQADYVATDKEIYHFTSVEQAIKKGKPVPPEVLKDYPELAKPAPKTEPKSGISKKLSPTELTDILEKGKVTFYKRPDGSFAGDANITPATNLNFIKEQFSNASVAVKDVNGQRATMSIDNYMRLSKEKGFTDRIREVRLLAEGAPEIMPEGFMGGAFDQLKRKAIEGIGKKTESEKIVNAVEDIEGITLENNSTVMKSQISLLQNILRDDTVRKNLKSLGIKKISIEPPHKFDLSTQAVTSLKNGEIKINADAINPTEAVLHEIGHHKYKRLTIEQKEAFKQTITTTTEKYRRESVAGYISLGKWEEVFADDFAMARSSNPLKSRLQQAIDIQMYSPYPQAAIKVKQMQQELEALAKSKPVPPEVLKDYPELVAQAKVVPATKTSPLPKATVEQPLVAQQKAMSPADKQPLAGVGIKGSKPKLAPTAKSTRANPKTLLGYIRANGGIKLDKDRSVQDYSQHGILTALNKSGKGLDTWYDELYDQGHISRVPSNMNPSDHVWQQLISQRGKKLPNAPSWEKSLAEEEVAYYQRVQTEAQHATAHTPTNADNLKLAQTFERMEQSHKDKVFNSKATANYNEVADYFDEMASSAKQNEIAVRSYYAKLLPEKPISKFDFAQQANMTRKLSTGEEFITPDAKGMEQLYDELLPQLGMQKGKTQYDKPLFSTSIPSPVKGERTLTDSLKSIKALASDQRGGLNIPKTPEQIKIEQQAKKQLMEDMRGWVANAKSTGRTIEQYLDEMGLTGEQITRLLAIHQEGLAPKASPSLNKKTTLQDIIGGDPAGEKILLSKIEFKNLKKISPSDVRDFLTRQIVDVSGNFKREAWKLGDAGENLVIRHDLAAGASGKAMKDTMLAFKKIYHGLSSVEEGILDTIIAARRVVVVKDAHPDILRSFSKKEALKLLNETIPAKIGKERAQMLNARADEFHQTMREQLTQKYENGLLTKELYDNLYPLDYSLTKFIQHIDPHSISNVGGKTLSVADSGLKSLDVGSTRSFETNSRKLLHETIARTQAIIFKNNASKALLDLAIKIPENGIVREAKIISKTTEGLPVYEVAPPGYERVSAMVGGETKGMIMPTKMAREWLLSNPAVNSTVAEILGWLSGAKLVRPMATGFNPEFPITNLPRDLAHQWFTTTEYSSFLPKAMLQMGKDLSTVFVDALWQKGRWHDMIDEGGAMPFLTQQGGGGRSAVSGAMEGVKELTGYLGVTSEILTRLSLRERALKNGLAAGLSYTEAARKATWIAKNYINFSQGGQLIKALDIGIPYLNAGVQGTRGIFRAAKKDPAIFTWKVAQVGALASGLYLANKEINRECLDSIPDRIKSSNWIITTPLSYTDQEGHIRHLYFKIAKDQGQRIVASSFEMLIAKGIYKESISKQLSHSAKDLIPLSPESSFFPIASATAAMHNFDTWTKEEIWKGRTDISPKNEYRIGETPDFLIRAGEKLNVSPMRMNVAFSKIVPRNIYTDMVGAGWKATVGELTPEAQSKTTIEILTKMPWLRRIMSVTPPPRAVTPGVREASLLDADSQIERERNATKIYQNMKKDTPSMDEVKMFLSELYKTKPKLAERVLVLVKQGRKGKDAWTADERALANVSVGARALFIKKELSKIPTVSARWDYVRGLGEKGIITEDVAKEIGLSWQDQ